MKRLRRSERNRKEDRDRISDLPDCVLLHIMKFMNTKHAVQTCVLSRRWKDLWKHLTNLTLRSSDFRTLALFSKFVSWVLSSRDGSISLHSLDFKRRGAIEPKLLNRVMRYAVSHDIQQLSINVNLHFKHGFEFPPCIFSCQSLTFLKLSIWYNTRMKTLPKSLKLPALKSLHLKYVYFTTSDNDCAEPFSTCNVLNTLVIKGCLLQRDAKVLCISNDKLSSLTIDSTDGLEIPYQIALSAPNLSSLTIMGGPPIHQLSSACNLSFLEEVNIDASSHTHFLKTVAELVVISWLQVIANVKIMTISSSTLEIILDVLSTPGSMRTQTPCFVRLKSLKVKMDSFAKISDEEVTRIVKFLLQNSPSARVDIINC